MAGRCFLPGVQFQPRQDRTPGEVGDTARAKQRATVAQFLKFVLTQTKIDKTIPGSYNAHFDSGKWWEYSGRLAPVRLTYTPKHACASHLAIGGFQEKNRQTKVFFSVFHIGSVAVLFFLSSAWKKGHSTELSPPLDATGRLNGWERTNGLLLHRGVGDAQLL